MLIQNNKRKRLASRAIRERNIVPGEKAKIAAPINGKKDFLSNIFLRIKYINNGIRDPAMIETNRTDKVFRPKIKTEGTVK